MHTYGGNDGAFLAVVALRQSITTSDISLVTQVVAIDLEAVLVYVIAQESIYQGVGRNKEGIRRIASRLAYATRTPTYRELAAHLLWQW